MFFSGADANVRNNRGQTAFQIAHKRIPDHVRGTMLCCYFHFLSSFCDCTGVTEVATLLSTCNGEWKCKAGQFCQSACPPSYSLPCHVFAQVEKSRRSLQRLCSRNNDHLTVNGLHVTYYILVSHRQYRFVHVRHCSRGMFIIFYLLIYYSSACDCVCVLSCSCCPATFISSACVVLCSRKVEEACEDK